VGLVQARASWRTSERHAAPVTHWPVDSGGVPAEWVEATVATTGQPTLVYFHGSHDGRGCLAGGRAPAADLAAATGARVLSVGCRLAGGNTRSSAVEDGVAAYAWLLNEGCDVDTTAFIGDPVGAARAVGVLLAARGQGLPVPALAAWGFDWVGATPSLDSSLPTDCTDLHARLVEAGAVLLQPQAANQGESRQAANI
jgi:monoterpene epsilon-lactone hydrolase